MKKVSVILPVYRVESYIAAAVQSVLEQTYPHFELLIIDDGSPDRSLEICQQFSDPRIRIIRQDNRGLAGARNTGIRQATGEYLAFLDGDDCWLPQKLEKHVQHLEHAPQVGLSFCRSAFINEHGETLGTYQMPKLTDIDVPELLRCNPIGNGSAPVIRREVFAAIRFSDDRHGVPEDCYFDEQFRQAEDLDCWLRIAIQTPWQLEGIPEALTLYRVNSSGLSASLLKQQDALEQVLQKMESYAPELLAQWGRVAQAYQLRYLARSAVRFQMGPLAARLIHQALRLHWRLLLEEPRRTGLILLAAYLLCLLPQATYRQLEAQAAKIAGALQRRHILSDQSR